MASGSWPFVRIGKLGILFRRSDNPLNTGKSCSTDTDLIGASSISVFITNFHFFKCRLLFISCHWASFGFNLPRWLGFHGFYFYWSACRVSLVKSIIRNHQTPSAARLITFSNTPINLVWLICAFLNKDSSKEYILRILSSHLAWNLVYFSFTT